MVDYWLPQGTAIKRTERDRDGGGGIHSRYRRRHARVVGNRSGCAALPVDLRGPRRRNSAYAQLLVDVDDYRKVDDISAVIQAHLEDNFVDSQPQVRKFILGPGEPGKIQARFNGPDPNVLRQLATQAEAIIGGHPNAFGVRNDWRERVATIRPVIAEEQANQNQISREVIAGSSSRPSKARRSASFAMVTSCCQLSCVRPTPVG